MKSVNGNDVKFVSDNDKPFQIKINSKLTKLKSARMKFRHQKYRQNNRELLFHADKKYPEAFRVINLAKIIQQKRRLADSMNFPFTVYLSADVSVTYLTGEKLTDIIRKAVRKAHPHIPEKEVQLYSCHCNQSLGLRGAL